MICIVLNSLGRGGAEKSILLLAEELLRSGVDVQIVCLSLMNDEYPVPAALQDRVVRLGAVSAWQALSRLRSHMAQQRPRIVFALMPQANLAAWLAGASLKLTVLTSERTTPTLFYGSSLKLLLSLLPHAFSARAVFISHYALDHGLPSHALGRAVRRNACVLHNPVPSPVPLSVACASRLTRLQRLRHWVQSDGTASPPLRLLLASRLVPGKGVLELVGAAQELLAAGEVELTIAGAGPLEAQLQSLVARNGVAARVHVQGFVENIHAAYTAADVVVLSSESEGFGRVGFEAYQAGCLVLGTPRNSFNKELLAQTPAWKVVPALSPLGPALQALAAQPVPDSGDDIAAMREALGIQVHAQRFMGIVSEAAYHV